MSEFFGRDAGEAAEAPGIHYADFRLFLLGWRSSSGAGVFGGGDEGSAGTGRDLRGRQRYLRIVFLGMPFTYLYNAVASALRSVGDSRTPVRFLAMASVLNGCLDLVFVAGLGLGVVGAALATDIAEAVSALLASPTFTGRCHCFS